MVRSGRRQFLTAVAAGGIVATTGCTLPSLGDDGQQGAEDWTQLRGTAGMEGLSRSGGPDPDATQQFTAEFRNGINVGDNAPLIGDDGIYGVGTVAAPYDTEPYTFGGYAFKCSREDGSEVWRREIAIREGEENFSFFRQSPSACLGSDGLYVTWVEKAEANLQLHVECRSRADGSEQWTRTIETVTHALQPVVRGDTLYVLAYGKLWALSIDDGSKRWQSDEFLHFQVAPSVGTDVVAVLNQGFTDVDFDESVQITAFDRSDGTERWSVPLRQTRGVEQLPTVAGNTVFVAEGVGAGPLGGIRGEMPARRIRALSANDGSERWSYTYMDESDGPAMAGGTTSVAVDGDTVYAGLLYPTVTQILGPNSQPEATEKLEDEVYTGRNLIAVNRADGSLQWETQIGTYAQVRPYLVVDETHLYVKYHDPGQEGANGATRWYVVEKETGDISGSFGGDGESERFRPFGVADGALFEHLGTGICVWE